MEWLKSVWARWKVQVSFVAGALVVATTFGTCTLEPPAVELSEAEPATESPETQSVEAVEVSATTTESAEAPTETAE
tara:strand:- start:258 stop:488 length:231 start_codon:yes stop_codon:yes gene_type:complete